MIGRKSFDISMEYNRADGQESTVESVLLKSIRKMLREATKDI